MSVSARTLTRGSSGKYDSSRTLRSATISTSCRSASAPARFCVALTTPPM
ncbi:hypothetical protein SVIOM342S_07210 [Streptomyces violaceorubidus]